MKTYLYRASNLKSTFTFVALFSRRNSISGASSLLYINNQRVHSLLGLAHTTSPTITKFRLAFLLTRLQEALYEDLPV